MHERPQDSVFSEYDMLKTPGHSRIAVPLALDHRTFKFRNISPS